MRIICPSCQAAYEVPDALLGAAARRLRCARCAHEWSPDLPAAEPPPPAAPVRAEVRPARAEPVRPLVVPRADSEPPPSLRARPRRIPGLENIAIVVASLALLAAVCWATYVWRAELMQVWPPSQRLFAVLGLQ